MYLAESQRPSHCRDHFTFDIPAITRCVCLPRMSCPLPWGKFLARSGVFFKEGSCRPRGAGQVAPLTLPSIRA